LEHMNKSSTFTQKHQDSAVYLELTLNERQETKGWTKTAGTGICW
jgi:hypothetical protein